VLVMQTLRAPREGSSPQMLLVGELVSFCVALGTAWMMAGLEKRPAGAYGLPLRGAFGKLVWLGCAVGLGEVCALMGLIAAFGGYSFGGLALHGAALAKMAIGWAVFFVIVGLFEEFMFRGYTQFTLADGIGFWPAGFVLSTLFALVHLHNQG